MQAPLAPRRPNFLTLHGHTRQDDYFWLNQREDADVLAHLRAENAYTAEMMAHVKDFELRLFAEIKGRIKQDDSTVPVRLRGYWYRTRYEEGKEYPIHARHRGSENTAEEILLDVNALAAGHSYYHVGAQAVSHDNRLLAYAYDDRGRRIYTIVIKDLESGALLPDRLENCSGAMAWANDGRTLFYVVQDEQTLRGHRVFKHRLGRNSADDEMVYEENDDTFHMGLGKSHSEEYLWIACEHTLRTEYRYLRADDPDGSWQVLCPRGGEHEYHAEHLGEHFYIVTNRDGATNFKLMRCRVDRIAEWEEVIPHRPEVFLEGMTLFREYLALEERQNGLLRIRVRRWDGSAEHSIAFDDPTYVASVGANPEQDTSMLRFHYTSLVQPNSVYDYDMAARTRTLRKVQEVVGGYDAAQYTSERLWAESADGSKVPISLVYRRDRPRQGGPLLLYGYGAYGITVDPAFNSARLSLLDRGFAFAIAHIRGGQYLGRPWYEAGKKLHKQNTFADFIAAGEHLCAEGYSSREHLYCMGGSAGGLLVGAVLNLRPDLFHGAVAQVPFVDVLTTMLDDSIPLTTGEYDQWGNPNEPAYYQYILGYSPYDNVKSQPYPHLLVMTGLHDSQVQYWEPAKWVAKLRRMRTNDTRLLLRVNMDAGHGGASGRFERLKEVAFEYTFLLDLEGLAN